MLFLNSNKNIYIFTFVSLIRLITGNISSSIFLMVHCILATKNLYNIFCYNFKISKKNEKNFKLS